MIRQIKNIIFGKELQYEFELTGLEGNFKWALFRSKDKAIEFAKEQFGIYNINAVYIYSYGKYVETVYKNN